MRAWNKLCNVQKELTNPDWLHLISPVTSLLPKRFWQAWKCWVSIFYTPAQKSLPDSGFLRQLKKTELQFSDSISEYKVNKRWELPPGRENKKWVKNKNLGKSWCCIAPIHRGWERLKESTGKESFNIVFTHTMHCSSIESFIKTADPNKRMQNFQTALMRITEVNTS